MNLFQSLNFIIFFKFYKKFTRKNKEIGIFNKNNYFNKYFQIMNILFFSIQNYILDVALVLEHVQFYMDQVDAEKQC